jgi:hypothetical protein
MVRNNLSGQMKIQQMAFMLLAVTLLFALVGLFFVAFKFSGLKESAAALEEENALTLVSRLANSPEFACDEAYGNQRTNCIDGDKIIMLKENIGKYRDFWGVRNIEVRKVYPTTDSEVLCDAGNYPNCNIIRLMNDEVSGFSASNFVALCRKESENGIIYNKCELAKLIVSYE